jgi:hypothetical protein
MPRKTPRWAASPKKAVTMRSDAGDRRPRNAPTAPPMEKSSLTARALGEPPLTLVRNDMEFGLLISSDAHEDSFSGRLYLDDVSYLRVAGKQSSYTNFDSVAIFRQEGLWVAQDIESGRYFPNPSHCPYHVVFISRAEHQRIEHSRAEGLAFPVFQAAQIHFGRLPGFSFDAKLLETPDDYANRGDAVSDSEYVLTTLEV